MHVLIPANRQRNQQGRASKGSVESFDVAVAVAMCQGYAYMSIECPQFGGFEVYCVNFYNSNDILDDGECTVNPEDMRLNYGRKCSLRWSICPSQFKYGTRWLASWYFV